MHLKKKIKNCPETHYLTLFSSQCKSFVQISIISSMHIV